MGWFKDWLDERRRVKMKRVEVGSIPRVWLGTLAILIGILAITVMSAAYMVAHALDAAASAYGDTSESMGSFGEQLAKSTGDIVVANPEVGMAAIGAMGHMDGDTTAKLAAISILKQVSASGDADVQGHIAGHFVSEDIRRMEKMNLSCVDAFTYYELNMSKPTYQRDLEIAKDRGGTKYAELNATAFIKVPLSNCAMKEYSTPTTADLVMDDFEVHRVTAAASFGGLPRDTR